MEIMENQGKLLADRPRMIAAGEMFSGGMSIGFTPFGDRFRRMRRSVICDTYPHLPYLLICDTEHFILISNLKQLRLISHCRCHTRRT